ncbi:hypothetical protein LBMAG21_02730 [Armatimonadota bacterium]|nr:hypothetical protein LBMAG21_02730 [Armatimonadota bacterium]
MPQSLVEQEYIDCHGLVYSYTAHATRYTLGEYEVQGATGCEHSRRGLPELDPFGCA